MTRETAKKIALDFLARSRRFRLVVDQHSFNGIFFNPLYSVVERIGAHSRYVEGDHGTEVWFVNRDEAEKWLEELRKT